MHIRIPTHDAAPMGHQRTSALPDTAPWRTIVRLLAEDETAGEVATAVSTAATVGLNLAKTDNGLVECVLALAEIAIAAREADFAAGLSEAGFFIRGDADTFELVAAFCDTMDRRLEHGPPRTDLGEMAQQASIETLVTLLEGETNGLFGVESKDLHQTVSTFSTKKGWATLAHEFFACFTQRFLAYHLGRELPQHVGGNGRFAHPDDHTEFVDDLKIHCREASAIMKTFAGDFYDKHRYLGGITRSKVQGFVHRSIEKLQKELERRGGSHV